MIREVKLATILALGIIVGLLVGCERPLVNPDLSPITVTLLTTITAPARPSPTSTPPIVILTGTNTPIVTPSPSVPSQTPTSVATFTATERESYVLELLSTNAGCELPCWWGVIPGNSTWSNTEQWILSLGARTGSTVMPDGSTAHGTGGFDFEESKIYNRVGFFERSGIVEIISIEAESHLNPEDFQAVWQRYSPQQIMSSYGQPSRVLVQSSSSAPSDLSNPKAGYSLWLFYDYLSFVIEYSGLVEYEPVYHICPRFEKGEDIASLKLFIQSPDNQRPLENNIQSYDLYRSYFHFIEEAAGLSVEEFYALFANKDEPACFDTPKAIWP